jgi:hypothetical protein
MPKWSPGRSTTCSHSSAPTSFRRWQVSRKTYLVRREASVAVNLHLKLRSGVLDLELAGPTQVAVVVGTVAKRQAVHAHMVLVFGVTIVQETADGTLSRKVNMVTPPSIMRFRFLQLRYVCQ